MIVSQLALTDYRNYESADVSLVPGANLVVGSNGQGKTNLVEAIGYLSTLGSHRVSGDQALIRTGRDSAIIRARLRHGDREVLLEAQLNRAGGNRAQVNRAAVKPRELPRHIATVTFAPEDLALVRGEPAGRRRFLDQLLVQLTPRLAGTLGDYDRVLRQRNSLLKSARGARVAESQLSTLELWDERLVEFGSVIVDARATLTERLRPHVQTAYERIAGAGHLTELALQLSILGSQPEDDALPAGSGSDDAGSAADGTAVAEAFRAAIARMRRAELDRGITLVGPHRDDLLLVLNGLPARGYASHGESWSFALALKLGSAALLRAESSLGDPVVILDDVFAELDEARRAQLGDAVSEYEQVIITAAVRDDVPPDLTGNTVRIRAGRVVEDES